MKTIRKLASWRMVGLLAAAAIFMAACSSASTPSTGSRGGTVTFAEPPGTPPNYISPLTSGPYYTVANTSDFSYSFYLPLYWFGDNGEPVLNKSLSVANMPVFTDNNTVVSFTLKHWFWSNGNPITAGDIIFWMNLLSASTDPSAPVVGSSSAPGPGWGAGVPGAFPENVVSYTQTGTYTVQFKLNKSYNPTWYTYNELSQINPIPQKAWDELSASGPIGNYDTSAQTRILAPSSAGLPADSYVPADPGTATTGALGVAQFVNSQAQDLTTYATNPLWQVVNGPFKLTQFTASGYVKMVPNKAYSGSPKPTISALVEEPFTTDTAEFDALRTGSLTIGYIPVQDLAQKASLEKTEGYSYNPWYSFSDAYSLYNFTDPTVGAVFKQLYFRQAFQLLVNQPQYIKDFGGGIGTVNNGPVPGFPRNNPDESPLEAKGLFYPFSPKKAVSLLKDNGWKVNPGGVTVCSKPGTAAGDCGSGIAPNEPLTFSMLYANGSTELVNEMDAMQSTMKSAAGLTINLKTEAGPQVFATTLDNCTFATPCTNWELANWGAAWVYSLDYLPTGDEIFATAASSNGGDYSNPTDDANITATYTATTHSAEIAALFKYQDYLVKQLPVAWMPNTPYQITMYKSNLKGLLPQGVYEEIYPQYYSFG